MRLHSPVRPQQKMACLTLSLIGGVTIAVGLMLVFGPVPVLADANDMGNARARYPHIVSTALDDCDLCHTSTQPSRLNSYGQAYRSDRSVSGLAAIEDQDSDGDGYLNIIEISELDPPGEDSDHPHDDALVRYRYPDLIGTRLDDCELCHLPTSTSLNSYGEDYHNHGRDLAAFSNIESLDSDGDGFTNLSEITDLTFPGDAADHPVEPTDDLTLVLQKYPGLANTVLDSCTLCHSSGTNLNGYGQDYLAYGRTLEALGSIEALDSDADGFTNLAEITHLTFPGNATSYPHDDTLLRQKYPALAGTRLDDCVMCHTTAPALNGYGSDYLTHGRTLEALGAVENLDSDGDSYANLTEITGLTFPGNASDSPAAQHNYELMLLDRYPDLAGTRLADPDTCQVCHHSDFTFNAYGTDYAIAYDFTAIEQLDSDSDGFINIDELNLLTFPGNPADYPADLALALAAYPHLLGSNLNACELCHTDASGSALNPYGQAYRQHGRNPAAFAAIEEFDSDGDHHANLVELTLLTFPGDPVDYPEKMSLVLLKYPDIQGTPLHFCTICHTGEWALNPYGEDYLTYGANYDALGLIETLDSDGDGYINLDEINALTFPGDPASSPAQNQSNRQVFLPLVLK